MKCGLLSYYEMLVVDNVSLTDRQYSRFLLLIAILVGIDLSRGLKYMEAEYILLEIKIWNTRISIRNNFYFSSQRKQFEVRFIVRIKLMKLSLDAKSSKTRLNWSRKSEGVQSSERKMNFEACIT